MLNIEELEKQFDQFLEAFTDKDLLDWLEFAEQREMLQKLQQGEIVKTKLKLNVHQIASIHSDAIDKIAFEKSADNYQYAMAA